jgi:anti-sigma regulatory factor (Ser/Thr protein kinase)
MMTGQKVGGFGDLATNIGPPMGSAWKSQLLGEPRPLNALQIPFVTKRTSAYWARRHTRFFLEQCQGITRDTVENAELLVCELVTNAVLYSGQDSGVVIDRASLITLSLRHFYWGLLIEVHDSSDSPPISRFTGDDIEYGRGLVIVNALSKEWSYFHTPDGKVVWCFLETA